MNRLADSLSPYLQQHAANPVDWHAWGEQALNQAKEKDKPILLSIGYAACHWCHVMAHESFEDDATAKMMNDNFINIKLDREERPDIDHIYQVAHVLMGGRSGGWPLTVFMGPDQVPFYVGTYFPPAAGRGMPSFQQMLAAMAETWKTRRKDIETQGKWVLKALRESENHQVAETQLTESLLFDAAKQMESELDPEKGGYRGAPKFAHPCGMEFCLSYSFSRENDKILKSVFNTLEKMGRSGLFDHVGGGFYRYCVDENWAIPHFEKMLYDNAMMLALYSKAYEISADPAYRRWIELTADWARREMLGPEGEFHCSLDADSEGKEGAFYVWTRDEIHDALSQGEGRIADVVYGLNDAPNFEGAYHLAARESPRVCAETLGLTEENFASAVEEIRRKLLERREARPRPSLDDKALASWNALMISGLYRAGRALGNKEYERCASGTLDFVRRKMMGKDGLFAVYRSGIAYQDGYLNDYAYLLQAALDSLDSSEPPDYAKDLAIELADRIVDSFSDPKRGGFFSTGHGHEELILRYRSGMDEVMPAGNSIAVSGLLRLQKRVGGDLYAKEARKCLESFSGHLREMPRASASMLGALMTLLDNE